MPEGKPNYLHFHACARGFTLQTLPSLGEGMGETYAFDRIEDLATWLVTTYGESKTYRWEWSWATRPCDAPVRETPDALVGQGRTTDELS